jgi:hypothetical protein
MPGERQATRAVEPLEETADLVFIKYLLHN